MFEFAENSISKYSVASLNIPEWRLYRTRGQYGYIYGTVHAKLAYHVFIYKVIKMIHFEIATSPEP